MAGTLRECQGELTPFVVDGFSSGQKLILSGLQNSATWSPNREGSRGVAATYAMH